MTFVNMVFIEKYLGVIGNGGLESMKCDNCNHQKPDRGQACDGRRAYRCPQCGRTWTNGMQGRMQRFSRQREGNQFADSKGRGHVL